MKRAKHKNNNANIWIFKEKQLQWHIMQVQTKVRVKDNKKENKYCKQGQESSHYFVSKPRIYPNGNVNYLTCLCLCLCAWARELGTSLHLQLSRFSMRKIATLLPEILPDLTHSILEEPKIQEWMWHWSSLI